MGQLPATSYQEPASCCQLPAMATMTPCTLRRAGSAIGMRGTAGFEESNWTPRGVWAMRWMAGPPSGTRTRAIWPGAAVRGVETPV